MRDTNAAQFAHEIVDQSALSIVGQPIFQVMKPRQVIPSSLSTAVTIQFDVMQHALRGPFGLRVIQHPGKRQ